MRASKVPAGLLAGCGAIFAAVIAALLYADRTANLYVVNGLDRPITFTVEESSTKVAPGAHRRITEVPVGTHEVVVTDDDGQLIERALIDVLGANRMQVYNVAGAAPVVWERVVYGRDNPAPAAMRDYCGQSVFDLERPDFVFEEPPRTIQVSSKSSNAVRQALFLAPGGFRACAQSLLGEGKMRELAALMSVAEPTFIGADDERGMAKTLARLSAAAPDSVEQQRALQDHYLRRGQGALLLPLYAPKVERPDATDVDYYLYARLLPNASSLPIVEQGLSRFPSSPWLLWILAFYYFEAEDYSKALTTSARLPLEQLPPERRLLLARLRIGALLHLGRGADALQEAEQAIGDMRKVASDDARVRDVELGAAYWAAARAAGTTPNLSFLAVGSTRRWVELLGSGKLVTPPNAEKPGPIFELVSTAMVDPERALAEAANVSTIELFAMPRSVQLLLLSEAWLRDERGLDRLEPLVGLALSCASARHFIRTGEGPDILDALTDSERAVFWLARGRWQASIGEDPEPAYRRTRALDVFHGIAVRALDFWPPPGRSPPRWSWDKVTASKPAE